MKVLGKLLVILGIVAIIPAGFILFRDNSQARKHDARIEELKQERTEVRETLGKVNLEYRGYRQSISSIPDSTRLEISGKISETYREYGKRISVLEMRERELSRLILRQRTMKNEVMADTGRFVGALGGGGVLMMLVGFVLTRRRAGLGG
jgi:hypothetical protein